MIIISFLQNLENQGTVLLFVEGLKYSRIFITVEV